MWPKINRGIVFGAVDWPYQLFLPSIVGPSLCCSGGQMVGSNPIKHLQPHRHSLIIPPTWHQRSIHTTPARTRLPWPPSLSFFQIRSLMESFVEVWLVQRLINFHQPGFFFSTKEPLWCTTGTPQLFPNIQILVRDFHQDALNPEDLFYRSLVSPGSCISNKRRRTVQRKRG